jgi:hypothetical protein
MNLQMATKELPAANIIMGDPTCQNGEGERVLDAIHHRLGEGNSLLIRKHNSLFFLTRIGFGEVEAHFYSVDSAIYAVRALKYFIDQTRDSGVHTLYIYDFSEPKMERMLKMIKLTVQPSDKEEFKYMLNLGRSM